MPAHLNITSTLPVTLGTGAEADDFQTTSSVEVDTLDDQATGEVIAAAPVNHKKIEHRISGDGPATLTGAAAGTVSTVSDVEITSVEITEAPNARCKFSITAVADDSFTDPAGTASDVGAEPAIGDLEITSVTYSVAESIRRSQTVENMVLVGTDGAPAFRAKVGVKAPVGIQGRGDLPAGVALGTGGADYKGAATGILVITTLTEGEKRKDWNRWGVDGERYPSAS